MRALKIPHGRGRAALMSKIISDTVVEKAPGETIERYFDFANHPEIVSGESLTGSPTVEELGGTSDLTIDTIAISGDKVTCNIAGGLATSQTAANPSTWRKDYPIRCTAETDSSPPHTVILEGILKVESSVQVSS